MQAPSSAQTRTSQPLVASVPTCLVVLSSAASQPCTAAVAAGTSVGLTAAP